MFRQMDRSASQAMTDAASIPLWIKVTYTLFLCVLVPVYAIQYGPTNFLWFSDLALLVTGAALWVESSLLASMMALAVLLPELMWNVGFFARLLLGWNLGGLSGYMFNQHIALYLRGLSLFHVFLPVLLLWMLYRLGYDRRALPAQTIVAMIVLPLSYCLSDPAHNMNGVFGPGAQAQHTIPPLLYLALIMV